MGFATSVAATQREASMAKCDQPSISTQRKPLSSSDKPVETDKKNKAELTDDELKKVSGVHAKLAEGTPYARPLH
jgi:hypothetical protein